MAEILAYIGADGRRLTKEEVGQLAEAEKVEARKRALKAEGRAQGKKEGRAEREREILATAGIQAIEDIRALPAIENAHAKHVTETRKANYHQGLTHGLVAAVLALVAGIYMGVTIQTSGWSMSVAEERIPRAVPTITDQYEEPAYERHPREPGTASN